MKLPILSSKELCDFLKKEGFELIRQKGSHQFFRHPTGKTTVVPIHSNKDIKRTLLAVILNEIQMSREEFLKKYK